MEARNCRSLGGQHHLLASALQRPTDTFFAERVAVGRVDEIDAQIERSVQECGHLLLRICVDASRAESETTDLQFRRAKWGSFYRAKQHSCCAMANHASWLSSHAAPKSFP